MENFIFCAVLRPCQASIMELIFENFPHTYAKFSERLTSPIPLILICTRMYAYQGVKNVSLSDNFAYLLN